MSNFLEELPIKIQNHIVEQTKDCARSDDRLYITELVDCIRKAYLNRRNPIEPSPERRWNLYRGKIFHQHWAPLFDLKPDKVKVTHCLKDTPAKITGRFDFAEGETVYELKTCDTPPETVREDHAQQVAAYAYMKGYQKAAVIYVSFNQVKTFEVPLDEAKELIGKLDKRGRELYNALVNDTLPEPIGRWNLSCDYCEFKGKCEDKPPKAEAPHLLE